MKFIPESHSFTFFSMNPYKVMCVYNCTYITPVGHVIKLHKFMYAIVNLKQTETQCNDTEEYI
jgi:hypothetical protein